MKKILTFAAVTLVGLVIFTGCQKSEPTTTTYSMVADIGGKITIFGNCFVNSSYNPVGPSNYIIEAVPDSQDFPSIFIAVPTVGVGQYTFGSSPTGSYAKYFPDSTTIDDAVSGGVTITSTVPDVKGTFTFTCTGGTIPTIGAFTAKVAY